MVSDFLKRLLKMERNLGVKKSRSFEKDERVLKLKDNYDQDAHQLIDLLYENKFTYEFSKDLLMKHESIGLLGKDSTYSVFQYILSTYEEYMDKLDYLGYDYLYYIVEKGRPIQMIYLYFDTVKYNIPPEKAKYYLENQDNKYREVLEFMLEAFRYGYEIEEVNKMIENYNLYRPMFFSNLRNFVRLKFPTELIVRIRQSSLSDQQMSELIKAYEDNAFSFETISKMIKHNYSHRQMRKIRELIPIFGEEFVIKAASSKHKRLLLSLPNKMLRKGYTVDEVKEFLSKAFQK